MIKIIKDGNLFASKADAWINTVNCMGVSGCGIALIFKNMFPVYYDEYRLLCFNNKVHTGNMLLYDNNEKPKYIISFPTKDDWRNDSEYSYISEGLKDLKKIIIENDIQSIAIPALGCKNGNLEWSKVLPMIIRELGDLTIDIELYEPLEN